MRTHLKYVAASVFMLGFSSAALAAETTGQYVDDSAVTAKVKAALMGDSQIKSTRISVETTQGVVQLTGSVENKSDETAALKDAKSVDGVKSVQDNLSVGAEQ